jgi:hypothetical protein
VALAAALSAITGIVSYKHGLTVARWTGNEGLVAYLVPLVPDLMIAMSSVTLIEASAMRVRRPATAVTALVSGIGWTVAQNIAAGWRSGWGGALIAAGIPLALVVTFESLLWLLRKRRSGEANHQGSGAAPAPEPRDTMTVLRELLDSESERHLAVLLKVDRMKVRSWQAALDAAAAEPVEDPAGADQGLVPAGMNGHAPFTNGVQRLPRIGERDDA